MHPEVQQTATHSQAPNAANAMPGGQEGGASAMRAALDKLKNNPEDGKTF